MNANQVPDTLEKWTQKPQYVSAETTAQVTIFTICNAAYFPGLVGLINSLRLLNQHDSIVVLDCGLTENQKQALSGHCTLFNLPSDLAKNPQQYKAFPYLLNPQGTVVIIDSDILICRSLEHLIRTAGQGKICVFPDPESERFFNEWQKIFDLPASLRRQPYINSGFVAFSTFHHPNLLAQWWHASERIFSCLTYQEGAAMENPVAQSDQDALNALLMSMYSLDNLELQPFEEEVFGNFIDVKVCNDSKLICQYSNSLPVLLHACCRPKPWEKKGLGLGNSNAYTYLLRRLLHSSDVAVKANIPDLPICLKPGSLNSLISTLYTAMIGIWRQLRIQMSLKTKLLKSLKK